MEYYMKNKRMIQNNLYLLKLIKSGSPGRIIFNLFVVLIKSISTFLFDAYMIRYIINGIQTGKAFFEIIIFMLCIAIYHIFVCFIENYFNEIYAPISDRKIFGYIQKKVFAQAASVDLACYEDPDFYDKYVKAISETSQRAKEVLASLGNIIGYIFTVCAMSVLIFIIDPILIVFALIPFLVSIIFGKRMNKIRYQYNMEIQEKSRKKDYISRVFYLSDYAKEIRLTTIHTVLLSKFSDAIRDLKTIIKKYGFKIGALDYIFMATNDIVVYLGAILYASFQTLVNKTMLLGDCIVIVNTINSIAWSLRSIADIYMKFNNHALYIDNLRYFLEYQPQIPENKTGLEVPKDCTFKFENVSFTYKGQLTPVLRNINLEIKPSEKIALVGHNGAGKTTLIKLLMRLYDPSEGRITLNDIPISEYKLEPYRELFGTVFQDYKIFSLSVTDNILLKDNITQNDNNIAINAMKNSGIYEKIASLQNAERTILTREFDEKGAILSGGEYQKIAIARVFAKPCKIVILDEPSSALDPISEYEMYHTMINACKRKSTVFISHRLSSAVLADQIYLIENGEMIERGSHFKLLEKKGKYHEMWEKQAEKYKI